MPFCDVMELFDYWREYPPMHWLMRGYVGFKPAPRDMPKDAPRQVKDRPPGKKLSKAPARDREIFESMRKANG